MKMEKIIATTPLSAQKKPEMLALVEKVAKINPKTIVEIGVMHGGTLAVFKMCFPEARVVGIDNAAEAVGRKEFIEEHGLEVIIADSQKKKTATRLKKMVGEIDFIFIDGDHSYEGVKKDWLLYSGLVRKGGIIAFHDIAESVQNWGVPRLWEEIEGKKEEIIIPEEDGRTTWGGIGVVYL